MKFQSIILIAICTVCSLSWSEQKIIELPLTQQDGYGYFQSGLGGISLYSEDENNPWKKTYLSVTGVPENWTEIKYGDIETNIYQTVYQNYLIGNITKERYEKLQKSWDWKPDTLELSKEALKCKIAFVIGKDSSGIMNMIVDANNNLDLSDDKTFIPFNFSPNENINKDSIALSNAINVSFERLIDSKKQLVTAPLFIAHMSRYNIFMYNFAQYSVTDFKGEKIAVCSDGFTNLLYKNPSIVLINDSLKDGDKISYENLIAKNEFIEVKGELYKNIGVNVNKNTLILEKVSLPKSELYSTQIGFKSFFFEGKDFMTASKISSESLKGKYVLLDFWAVGCAPCRQEIPNLKELYEKTDREKFEIVGVVGDSPSNALKKIIEKYSITWTQILSTDSNKIKETYGVHGYPTTFLINPEGIIVAKNLRGKELEEKVFSLINE